MKIICNYHADCLTDTIEDDPENGCVHKTAHDLDGSIPCTDNGWCDGVVYQRQCVQIDDEP